MLVESAAESAERNCAPGSIWMRLVTVPSPLRHCGSVLLPVVRGQLVSWLSLRISLGTRAIYRVGQGRSERARVGVELADGSKAMGPR